MEDPQTHFVFSKFCESIFDPRDLPRMTFINGL